MYKASLKRTVVLALVAVMLFSFMVPSALAEETAVVISATPVLGVTAAKVSFRQNPTTNAKPYVVGMSSIPKGKTVEVLGFIGAYYKVSYKGFLGYVKNSELGFSGADAVTKELVYFRIKATGSTSAKYRVVGCPEIPAASAVKIIGASGSYSKVEYAGFTGYVRTQDLAVSVTDLTPKLESYVVTDLEPHFGKTLAVVNFRQFPEASTLLVAKAETIAKGKSVIINGEYGDFYRITYAGYTGFAYKRDLSVGAAVNYTVTPVNPAQTGVALDVLNFRQHPFSDSERVPQLEKIKKNASVTVIGIVGEFYQISYGGYTGFAYQKDIRISGGTPTPTPTPPANGGATPGLPTGAPADIAGKMATAQAKNGDVVGYIYIEGTNIDHPIYNNRYDTKKGDFYYNSDYTHIFTMASPGAAGPACIMGHNMRTSLTMFHYLHHVQNRIMGKSSCEKCGKSVAGVSSSTVFTLLYDGYSYYELFAMYETPKTEPRATLNYNALNSNATGADKEAWINYQLMRSQYNFGVTPTANDKIVILVTCGDLIGGTTGARLYMCLRGVS